VAARSGCTIAYATEHVSRRRLARPLPRSEAL
jgi:hypothetical protein